MRVEGGEKKAKVGAVKPGPQNPSGGDQNAIVGNESHLLNDVLAGGGGQWGSKKQKKN